MTDDREANKFTYVLGSGYHDTDKKAIIILHQLLQCYLSESRELITGKKRLWFTGKKRVLSTVVNGFRSQGIEVEISLIEKAGNLPELSSYIFWQDVVQVMHKRLAV